MKWKNIPATDSTWEDESFIQMHPQQPKRWGQHLSEGDGMLSLKCGHIPPYIVALYPLYGGVDVGLGLLVVIVHRCLLYIGRRYFHLIKHCILSCLGYTSTLCKEVPPSKRIVIYLFSSLLRRGLLSSSLFILFLCYLWNFVA